MNVNKPALATANLQPALIDETTQVTLAVQPIFRNLPDGLHLAFVEALLRVFVYPRSGSIHTDIISVAEEIGFIHHIDCFVLDRLIQTLNRNPAISGSINISQRTIADDAASIVRRLRESNLGPRIIVEITETASVPLELVQRFAVDLHRIGCYLAIDDFETGSADEALVRAVKPQFIKVILDEVSPAYRARIDRTLALAREMNAQVVVERIDSKEKLEYVTSAGIPFVQGFLLEAPILEAQLSSYLSRCNGASIAINNGCAPAVRFDLSRLLKSLHSHGQVSLVKES